MQILMELVKENSIQTVSVAFSGALMQGMFM